MAKFAKIIELPNEQVVIMKGYDEEDGFTVEVHTEVGGMGVSAKLGFEDNEVNRDKAFDTYSDEKALEFHTSMTKLLLEDEEE